MQKSEERGNEKLNAKVKNKIKPVEGGIIKAKIVRMQKIQTNRVLKGIKYIFRTGKWGGGGCIVFGNNL
jgi:hypothetical protein